LTVTTALPLRPGTALTVLTTITEWQVNPTSLGRRSMDTYFDDGNRRLLS
jgi:hypothetical protein